MPTSLSDPPGRNGCLSYTGIPLMAHLGGDKREETSILTPCLRQHMGETSSGKSLFASPGTMDGGFGVLQAGARETEGHGSGANLMVDHRVLASSTVSPTNTLLFTKPLHLHDAHLCTIRIRTTPQDHTACVPHRFHRLDRGYKISLAGVSGWRSFLIERGYRYHGLVLIMTSVFCSGPCWRVAG